ncbi:hypothetical protein DYB37_005006 [Aphanomyces astaci]|uniref:WW domain-containing protein n=1 Tax=Aphanomyces astaci TaxID=112090 RepID=A0A418EG83_APHAT|nr:hypothetical protein DYB37_005006 [Aphanomyces astaci]
MGSQTARWDSDQRRTQEAGMSLLGLAFDGSTSHHASPSAHSPSSSYGSSPVQQHQGYAHAVMQFDELSLGGVDPDIFMEGVMEHSKYLGMDPERDQDLLWIARKSLVADIPPGWHQVMTQEGVSYYYNDESGDSRWEHPSDQDYKAMYREATRMKAAGEPIDASLYAELNECKKKLELQREHQDVVDALQRTVHDIAGQLEAQLRETLTAHEATKAAQNELATATRDKHTNAEKVAELEETLKQVRQQLMRLQDAEKSTAADDVQVILKQLTKEKKLRFQWEQKFKVLEDQHQALMTQVDAASRQYEMDRQAAKGDIEAMSMQHADQLNQLQSEHDKRKIAWVESENALRAQVRALEADKLARTASYECVVTTSQLNMWHHVTDPDSFVGSVFSRLTDITMQLEAVTREV